MKKKIKYLTICLILIFGIIYLRKIYIVAHFEPWQSELYNSLLKLNSYENNIDNNNKKKLQIILEIWLGLEKLKKNQNFMSYWWKSEDRVIRSFVIALYYSFCSDEVSGFPDFDSFITTFNSKESYERKEELKFVIDNLGGIKFLILEIIKKKYEKKYKSYYKKYHLEGIFFNMFFYFFEPIV